MKNSDVGLALAGVVVGVIIGAGSLLSMEVTSLGADIRDIGYVRVRPRETVQEQLKLNAAHPTVQSSSVESTVAAPTTECTQTTKTITELMTSVNYWVPKNVGNTQRRLEIQKVADAIIARVCPAPASTSMKKADASTMKAGAPAKVDNECDKLLPGSVRYAKCLGSTQDNVPYDGTKTNGYQSY